MINPDELQPSEPNTGKARLTLAVVVAAPLTRNGAPAKVRSLRQRLSRARGIIVEATHTLLALTRFGFISGVLACIVNYIYTFGNFFSGVPPASQSNASFLSATMGMATTFHFTSLFVADVLAMRSLHRVNQPNVVWGLRRISKRLIQRTFHFYVISNVLTVATTYWIVVTTDRIAAAYKLYVYVGCLANTILVAGIDEACRTIFQRETEEGRQRGHRNSAPYWKRFLRALLRAMYFAVMIILPSGFVHICSALTLKSEFDFLLFGIIGMTFKALALAFTKHVVLNKHHMQSKTLYAITAVPTVLINTQLRLFMLRTDFKSSLKGFFLLAVIEPVTRMFKTWWVKRGIRKDERLSAQLTDQHDQQTVSAEATEPAHDDGETPGKRTLTARTSSARYRSHSSWKQSVLQFHAAESHADMGSEYIAIACSVSIFYFFHEHPKFGWDDARKTDNSGETGRAHSLDVDREHPGGIEKALFIAFYQVIMEVVVDFACSMWELWHGIPLHNLDRLGGFLTALFACLALTSVSISAMLHVRDS